VNLPPDIALPLAKRGFLQDVAKDDSKLSSTYVKGALAAYNYKGVDGTFGYPWYLNTDVDYWNKTMFQKCGLDPANPPKTTDELFTQAETMHQKCPDDYLMSRKPGLSDFSLADVLSHGRVQVGLSTSAPHEDILAPHVWGDGDPE
ncbi:extracellular solute-binding protein, partial [Bacillus sp. S34]|nr:extracellular solute-binding protein [Bacillus sp. S34]